MKDNELRLGNWVKLRSGVISQVISQIDMGHEIDSVGLQPIELTDEWLEKFGFHSKYKSVHMQWRKGMFQLEQKSDVGEDHGSIPQENIWYFGYSGWVVDVTTVHQLQNLYFAITGEELERG